MWGSCPDDVSTRIFGASPRFAFSILHARSTTHTAFGSVVPFSMCHWYAAANAGHLCSGVLRP